MFKSYEDCSAHKKNLRPDGVKVVEGDAVSPLQQTAEKTLRRTIEAFELSDKVKELRDKNGGQLAIVYYVSIGTGKVQVF